MPASAQNRNQLIHAAADLFWRNGYDGTSLADVAKASGVPIGNIYYYFKTKASLAQAVGDLMRREMEDALAAIEDNNRTPRERLSALVTLLSATNASRTERGCPIAAASHGFRAASPAAAEAAAGPFRTLIAWLTAELVKCDVTEEDAANRAEAWLVRWQGAIALAHAMEDRAILDRAMGELAGETGSLAT